MVSLENSKKVFMACVKLHNFCINEREPQLTVVGGVGETLGEEWEQWYRQAKEKFRETSSQGRRKDMEKSFRRAEVSKYLMSNGIFRPKSY